jgi:hypothetical protein
VLSVTADKVRVGDVLDLPHPNVVVYVSPTMAGTCILHTARALGAPAAGRLVRHIRSKVTVVRGSSALTRPC